ncbi:MAG: DUF4416 family protein [Leptospira sp.]|nr:DUF4416 family protein [Leptospira sp.]
MSKLVPIEDKLTKPEGATFFLLVSYELDESYFRVKELSEEMFSKSLYESVPMPKWMLKPEEKTVFMAGSNTRILSFQQRINREELPGIYKECLSITKKLRKLDPLIRLIPGYLTRQNIVLASAISDFHKIYLFHGVYAEIIYKYIGSRLVVLETSPAFFHTKESIYFFTNLRESHEYHLNKKI